MNLFGEKVILRAVETADRDILKSLINDPEIEGQLGGKSFPVSDFTQENWIKSLAQEQNVSRYMVVSRESNETAGTIIMNDIDYVNGNAQIHIKLKPQFQGKGLGTDAIKLLVKYAFQELRLECIYAYIIDYNQASLKLVEACGFEIEGRLRKRIFKNGTFYDQYAVSILKG